MEKTGVWEFCADYSSSAAENWARSRFIEGLLSVYLQAKLPVKEGSAIFYDANTTKPPAEARGSEARQGLSPEQMPHVCPAGDEADGCVITGPASVHRSSGNSVTRARSPPQRNYLGTIPSISRLWGCPPVIRRPMS